MTLLVVTLGKTWVIIWTLHFFFVSYISTLENMAVKKWHQLAEEKSAVDQQEQEIHQKFRMDKINKEFGQLSGEELFKPITKRLDKKSSTTAEEEQEEEQEGPDYAIDEFDEINPFGDEFRPDAPSPELPLPPPPSPTPTTTSYLDVDDDDFPQPPSPLMKEKSARKEWGMPGPVEPEYQHESTLLQTVNQLITKYGNDPNYIVKSKKSPLQGRTIAELKKIRDGIYEKKKGNKRIISFETVTGGETETKIHPPTQKRNSSNPPGKSCHEPKTFF